MSCGKFVFQRANKWQNFPIRVIAVQFVYTINVSTGFTSLFAVRTTRVATASKKVAISASTHRRLGKKVLYFLFSRINKLVSVFLYRQILGVFHLPKTFGNFHEKFHGVKNVFHLTQVLFFYALVTKIGNGGTDVAMNSLELVISCENS